MRIPCLVKEADGGKGSRKLTASVCPLPSYICSNTKLEDPVLVLLPLLSACGSPETAAAAGQAADHQVSSERAGAGMAHEVRTTTSRDSEHPTVTTLPN